MTTAIIVIVLLLVAAAAAFLWMRSREAKRREGLQNRFGPEYDRAVEQHGDRKAAERQLADTADRRDSIEVRQLAPAERSRYITEWTQVQADFVDSPPSATRDADRLVQSVMRDRGYPVDDFETRSQMLAADHPDVVEHYRAAHAVGSRQEAVDTEELRQAFVHYRALFVLLLDDGREQTEQDAGAVPAAERTETTSAVDSTDRTDPMLADRTDDMTADRTDRTDGMTTAPTDRTDAMPADRSDGMTTAPADRTDRDDVDLRTPEDQPHRTT
jgi:hypothetical protein